jgi:hypothetical protein
VDQISVVHAGKIEREIGVGASVGKMVGYSPGLSSQDVGSDCLINLVVGEGLSTIAQAVVASDNGPLQLKRGRAAASAASVRRQARRQARRRAGRQERRRTRGEALWRSEKRRKEAGKRHERRCREAMKREEIWLCISFFCVLFGFDQPRQSLAKRLTKKRQQSQRLDAMPPCVVSGVAFCVLFGFAQPRQTLVERLAKKCRQSRHVVETFPCIVPGHADVNKSQEDVVHASHFRKVTTRCSGGGLGAGAWVCVG